MLIFENQFLDINFFFKILHVEKKKFFPFFAINFFRILQFVRGNIMKFAKNGKNFTFITVNAIRKRILQRLIGNFITNLVRYDIPLERYDIPFWGMTFHICTV